MSVIKKLYKNGYLSVEQHWATETHYEVMCGSVAYGANSEDANSDIDVHAITTPPIDVVFPHTVGYIDGFGQRPQNFETFQQHGILAYDNNYDVAIYSIIKTFQLAADNNPNILDMLWVPEHCILHSDAVGKHIRMNRKHFLHKGSYHRFRGYAHQQFKRLENSNRTDLIEKYGYDTKFAYHIVRLCLQGQQILETGDMDFAQNRDFIKEIRNGALTLPELRDWYVRKEAELDKLYHSSTIPYSADMKFLKEILLACLEMKYGSLEKVFKGADSMAFRKLEQIRQLLKEE